MRSRRNSEKRFSRISARTAKNGTEKVQGPKTVQSPRSKVQGPEPLASRRSTFRRPWSLDRIWDLGPWTLDFGPFRPWTLDLIMRSVTYSKYTGEDWDSLSVEELLNKLSDFLLQSGFKNPY